jgi:hypothetical protein
MYREFSARVPEEDYKEFVRLTDGVYGATTWFITTALKTFIGQQKETPTPREQIVKAIRSMIEDRKEEVRT